MANEATKVRGMLNAVRSQLRNDLRQMAEDVLQQPFGAGREAMRVGADVRNLDVEHLRTELALRTMASQYALLSRLDKALDPPSETPCASPGYDDEQYAPQIASSHAPVAV